MEQSQNRYLPDTERLSVLVASLLLAYVVARLVELPTWQTEFTILGAVFGFKVDVSVVVGVIIAGLAASGADWLYHDHPGRQGRSSLPHWLLPALTALLLAFSLNQLPFGVQWWLGLFLGSIALALILLGEYISIDASDARHPLAGAVLTAGCYALHLAASATLLTSGVRLYLLLPAMFLSTLLVSLRILFLRFSDELLVYEAGLIAFLVSQWGAALYYWRTSPVAFGLLLLGATYALNSLMSGLIRESSFARLIREPLLAISLAILAALVFR